ncbi:hypothetical protein [Aeromicrobium sp.]|uniref:hypothetical protein n=1 Tax=Aeromicrobium sp. TaxID=1871063 RepID=UPI003C41C64E
MSRSEWAVTCLAVASLAAWAPDVGDLAADVGGASFPAALLAIGGLVHLVLSAWILLLVALSAARVPPPVLRAVAPRLVRQALLAGTVSALALAPASAEQGSAPAPQPTHDLSGLRVPDRPAVMPGAGRGAEPVTVHAGDTLWSIVAHWLPADAGPARIALGCRRWHEVNREVIGPDPNLIVPAQLLVPPAGKEPT